MEFFTDLFDISLIYYPNILFAAGFLLVIIGGFLFMKIIIKVASIFVDVYREWKHKRPFHISYASLFGKLMFVVTFLVSFFCNALRYINKNLQHVELIGKKIAKIIKKEVFISCLIAVLFIVTTRVYATEYRFAWPGILPDNPLYKVKILRNKIIERLIIHPVRKVEFDLLMADKTLYASKLLLDKGEFSLARETALKGENYFSILAADYARIAGRKGTIPEALRVRIALAYTAHKQLILYLHDKAPEQDKKTYENIGFFSDENYRVLQKLLYPQQQVVQ